MIDKSLKKAKPTQEDIARVLGKTFWQIVEHYGLSQKDQATLLGIKENRQRLNSLKSKQEIPDDPDKLLRVGHLVGIHKSLRILFPQNRDVVYAWLKTKRDLFQGRSALEYIAEDPIDSLPRLFSVRRLLDQLRVAS
jgi:hypothetical protein